MEEVSLLGSHRAYKDDHVQGVGSDVPKSGRTRSGRTEHTHCEVGKSSSSVCLVLLVVVVVTRCELRSPIAND